MRKVVDAEVGEVRLYCHSARREEKEKGINRRFCERFEAGLAKLAVGLASPRGEKRPALIQERIGKLKQRSFGVRRHYPIFLSCPHKNCCKLSTGAGLRLNRRVTRWVKWHFWKKHW